MRDAVDLVGRLRTGDRRAIARVISLVENGSPQASEILRALYPHTGHAVTIGITGSPGSGKSTLTDALISLVRAKGLTVGVVAVDPTSPFSGGALLGDRVRMQEHALDEGVFIRSMATRGHLGGLSLAAPEAMRVLEAAGKDVVIVETVGVGQSEVEVAGQADTTIVVVAPGMGDAIQAAKAGVLEVADVFCINKADKDGANDTARDLRNMLEMGHGRDPTWNPPIVRTVATQGTGVDELWEAVSNHREHLSAAGSLEDRRRQRLGAEILAIVTERLRERVEREAGARYDELVQQVVDRELDPYTAADRLLSGM
ncbi:MAG TPA: methylmalonyl Co-A mutase-associated GTPase MeaB [Actinomycetota bacterium]|nr:methylmalonyl Co-A mutase-associated GTPase MeaB [Actinomycetota bacterium]